MKITAVSTPQAPVASPSDGRSASAERMAAVVAKMEGREPAAPETSGDAQVDRAQEAIKKIKMRTNRNTTVLAPAPAEPTPEAVTTDPVDAQSDIPATNEQATAASEATKPLSPQFAALAREKRALQAMKREIDAQRAALAQPNDATASGYTKEQIKANALSVLREAGVTNEELTEAVLRESQDYGPGYSKLEAEVNTLKQLVETQAKSLTDQEANVERQVLSQIRSDVDGLVSQGDEFEAVREAGYQPKVVELMHQVFKKEGKLLDASEAATIINNELIDEALKFARLKTVQGRLKPPAPIEQPQAPKPSAPNTKTMRTLTNRDGSSAISTSRRERAIAAAEGRLK